MRVSGLSYELALNRRKHLNSVRSRSQTGEMGICERFIRDSSRVCLLHDRAGFSRKTVCPPSNTLSLCVCVSVCVSLCVFSGSAGVWSAADVWRAASSDGTAGTESAAPPHAGTGPQWDLLYFFRCYLISTSILICHFYLRVCCWAVLAAGFVITLSFSEFM